MRRILLNLLWGFLITGAAALCQERNKRPVLTVETIMQDPKWMGSSPHSPRWSEDSRTLYFYWNPENADSDSLYKIGLKNGVPVKCSPEEVRQLPVPGVYNKAHTLKVYVREGDIFLENLASKKTRRVTRTQARETGPAFTLDEKKIVFSSGDNLFRWGLEDGTLEQLTDFRQGRAGGRVGERVTEQEEWLKSQEQRLIETLRLRKDRSDDRRGRRDTEGLKPVYFGDGTVQSAALSPNERFVTYQVMQRPRNEKRTIVPNYVTESGFTTDIPSRSKVGAPFGTASFFILDLAADSIISVPPDSIPGIADRPAYLAEYADADTVRSARPEKHRKVRDVRFSRPVWSNDGKRAVMQATSLDNKDRWILALEPATGRLTLLDRQHDEAWIGGPGIGGWQGGFGWMDDSRHIWFQSEESGYSHLYCLDVISGEKSALTSGKFEVYSPALSRDKKFWYFTANREHPGERHFYRMPADGGTMVRLTREPGSHRAALSPDESAMAVLYSASNEPWELYIQKNAPDAVRRRITTSTTEAFRAYPWRRPEILTFKAGDGMDVYARLYRPDTNEPGGPAVIFVHGAGYLQNAHKWWSSYFREYMFHNLLADLGYTVMDIDYRGSAGYGRDWRTAIYRDMGGKDLSDQVDGAGYLCMHCGIDPRRIGIYGGSYGGFITLMAMFRTPGVFAAGAALRPVTDWAHYNHGYTSDILNVPYADSLAYIRSSPIYHAEGLQGALLICHGMVDTNVHFQDTVRLVQRLIELGKRGWEVALYPVEDHSFSEPSSWTDEYNRILTLFETHLK